MAKNDDYFEKTQKAAADKTRRDADEAARKRIEAQKDDYRQKERQKTMDAFEGKGCFPGRTLIATPDGQRKIATFKVGELVISINQKNNRREFRKVLKVASHTNKRIWRLEFSDGNSIHTTSVHSFLVNAEWKKASQIKSGDVLSFHSNRGEVSQKTISASYDVKSRENVYNLIVEKDFNFLAEGVLAHSFTYFKSIKILIWSFAVFFHSFFRAKHREIDSIYKLET